MSINVGPDFLPMRRMGPGDLSWLQDLPVSMRKELHLSLQDLTWYAVKAHGEAGASVPQIAHRLRTGGDVEESITMLSRRLDSMFSRQLLLSVPGSNPPRYLPGDVAKLGHALFGLADDGKVQVVANPTAFSDELDEMGMGPWRRGFDAYADGIRLAACDEATDETRALWARGWREAQADTVAEHYEPYTLGALASMQKRLRQAPSDISSADRRWFYLGYDDSTASEAPPLLQGALDYLSELPSQADRYYIESDKVLYLEGREMQRAYLAPRSSSD